MEVECLKHPGASTIGSQLQNETAPMAGKSWQPSHDCPHAEGQKGTSYIQQKQGGVGGNNPETCSNTGQRYNKHVDNRRTLLAQAYQC